MLYAQIKSKRLFVVSFHSRPVIRQVFQVSPVFQEIMDCLDHVVLLA